VVKKLSAGVGKRVALGRHRAASWKMWPEFSWCPLKLEPKVGKEMYSRLREVAICGKHFVRVEKCLRFLYAVVDRAQRQLSIGDFRVFLGLGSTAAGPLR